ncbi:Lipoprotein-releasing system transmembrane protein LolC [Gammaproteobacteria bacterium]
MQVPLEFWIGIRYIRAKRRTRFVSFITVSAMLGVALGVMALITVLSVMSGFEQELRSRILGMIAHATITGSGDYLSNWQTIADQIAENPKIVASTPYIESSGMLVEGSTVSGVTIRGIVPESETSILAKRMRSGQIDDLYPGGFGILLGRDLAMHLGAYVGSKVTLAIPEMTSTPLGPMPRFKRFTVVGIFQVGMYEYDSALAVIHLQDAARLFRLSSGEVTGLRLTFQSPDDAPEIAKQLATELPPTVRIEDWSKTHVAFFHAVRTEQIIMFIILTLIVAVAAFNIVSTLVMTVTEKEPDIAILRTLGLNPSGVMRIFLVQGTLIGFLGTTLGVIGGILLTTYLGPLVSFLEQLFGARVLSPDVYYITKLPTDLQWEYVVRASAMGFFLSSLATWFPARRASHVQPAAALRHV